jgi:hypothetical protein
VVRPLKPRRPESPDPRCAVCGLPVAAWAIVRGTAVYCTAFCAQRARDEEPTRPTARRAVRVPCAPAPRTSRGRAAVCALLGAEDAPLERGPRPEAAHPR